MKKKVYIASPLFTEAQREYLENLVKDIAKQTNLREFDDIYLPHRDTGDLGISGGLQTIFDNDIKILNEVQLIVAIIDGSDVDSGTAAEIGYAYATNIPIYALLTDFRAYKFKSTEVWRLNNMIWGMCNRGNNIFRKKKCLINAIKGFFKDE